MKEINRHILLEGLSNLPEHSAPADVWENIETMVYRFPTDILPVHEPAAGTWNSISSQLGGNTSWFNQSVKIISIIALLLISGSIIIWNTSYSPTHKSDNNKPTKHRAEASIIPADLHTDIINQVSEKPPIEDVGITFTENSSSEDINPLTINKELSAKVNESKKNEEPSFYKPILNNRGNTFMGRIESRNECSILCIEPDISLDIKEIDLELAKIPQDYCDFNYVEKCVSFGIGAEYQLFFSDAIPEGTEMKYWTSSDLRIKFQRNKLSLETGVGIGFSSDRTNFTYNYLTNELVDSYEYVDSIHYDPITGTTQYFTTTVEVWDSISYTSQSAMKKDYRYLQVPLILGYDVLVSEQFFLTLNAGLVYSTEIDIQSRIPNIYHENSRVTSIDKVEISRNTEFLRITGGLRFGWNFSSKLSLIIDPSFNYYLNEIYKNINLNSPLSVSLRCGLYYNF